MKITLVNTIQDISMKLGNINVDKITKGDGPNGSVSNPDKILCFRSE